MPANLFRLVEPLTRFDDHRTYPSAINAVHRVLSTEGTEAARQKVSELVELYEDVYLIEKVG
jgi:hypothetical protein